MKKLVCLLVIFCLVSPCFAERSTAHKILDISTAVTSNALMYHNKNYLLGGITSALLIYRVSYKTTGIISNSVCLIYDIVRVCKGDGYAYIPLSLFTLKIMF